jgi:hypothetical protein
VSSCLNKERNKGRKERRKKENAGGNINETVLSKSVSGCWAPVVHTCNPSYKGGRNQEDHGSKAARVNSSVRPYL